MGKGTKVCINGPGHMTKMAATSIYSKKPLIFSRIGSPMILKLCMRQRLYKWLLSVDLNLFYGQIWYLRLFYRKKRKQWILSHLSQRLIGELIGFSWSGVRRRSSVVNNFKHLLQNPLPDQSQILCRASVRRGNESLLAASGSHYQDGRHAHIW